MNKEKMISRIDLVADTQRAKIVGDPVRAFEYYMTELAARDFLSKNFTGQVPELVKSWCDATGLTPQQATEEIIKEADLFHGALALIRRLRLVGKQAVLKSSGDGVVEFENTIMALKQIG